METELVHSIVKTYFKNALNESLYPLSRELLANVIAECAADNAEEILKQSFFALEGPIETARTPKGWQINPACTLYNANRNFIAKYGNVLKKENGSSILPSDIQFRKGYGKDVQWVYTPTGRILSEMLHGRLSGLGWSEKKEFVYSAICKFTDETGIFKLLQFSKDEKPPYLFNSFCNTYNINGQKDFRDKVVLYTAAIIRSRNDYFGHAIDQVTDKDTTDKYLSVISAFKHLIQTYHLDRDENKYEAFVNKCNEVEKRITRKALNIKYLEESIPGFDYNRFHALLLDYIDDANNVVYLHSVREIAALFSAETHYTNKLAEQEQQIAQLKAEIARINAEKDKLKSIKTKELGDEATQEETLQRVPLLKLQKYESGFLTKEQKQEIFSNSYVMADTTSWLKPHIRSFIVNEVLPVQQGVSNPKCVLVDANTRNEIDAISTDSAEARATRQLMHQLHKANNQKGTPLKYYNKVIAGNTSRNTIFGIIENNPAQWICLLTMDFNFCKLIAQKEYHNVIALCVTDASSCMIHPSLRKITKENCNRTIINVKLENQTNPVIFPIIPKPKQANNPQQYVQNQPTKKKNEPKALPLPVDDGAPITKTVKTESGLVVQLTNHIAHGGEGDIYHTKLPGYAAKLYHEDKRTQERENKIKLMLRKDPLIHNLCWPVAALYEEEQFAGYLMPLVDDEYEEFGKTIFNLEKKRIQQTYPKWDRLALAKLCKNICVSFGRLHKAGILMGDVNPRNIMVRIGTPEDPRIFIVDCDSFQIGEYPCPAGITDYLSPRILEMQNVHFENFLRTTDDEQFALAVFLFLVLMLKSHPYDEKGDTDRTYAIIHHEFPYRFNDMSSTSSASGADVPDGANTLMWSCLPYTIRKMFYETFRKGKTFSADEWSTALGYYIKDLQNSKCTRELQPSTYYDPETDPTKRWTHSFICSCCGASANMPNAKWESGQKKFGTKFQPLCNNCLMLKVRLQKQLVTVWCCGKNCTNTITTDKWTAVEVDKGLRKVYCSDCQYIGATCSECGKIFNIQRKRKQTMEMNGKILLCPDCLNKKSWYKKGDIT